MRAMTAGSSCGRRVLPRSFISVIALQERKSQFPLGMSASSSKKTNDDEDNVAMKRNSGSSASQKRDALEAALNAGHDHVVSQIVSYGMDLNVGLFGYNFISPLGWAVDHKKLHLVRLMLTTVQT